MTNNPSKTPNHKTTNHKRPSADPVFVALRNAAKAIRDQYTLLCDIPPMTHEKDRIKEIVAFYRDFGQEFALDKEFYLKHKDDH